MNKKGLTDKTRFGVLFTGLIGIVTLFFSCSGTSGSGSDSLTIHIDYSGASAGQTMMVGGWNSMSSLEDFFTGGEDGPDYGENVDLTNGSGTVTVVFEDVTDDILYVGAFIDADGNDTPDNGEYGEFYNNISFMNYTNASSVSINGSTSISINLDQTIGESGDSLTVNISYSGASAGQTMMVGGWNSMASLSSFFSGGGGDPDYGDEEELTAGSGTVTIVFSDVTDDALYIGVFIDADNNDSPDDGEYGELYNNIEFMNYTNATSVTIDGSTSINVNLDQTISF